MKKTILLDLEHVKFCENFYQHKTGVIKNYLDQTNKNVVSKLHQCDEVEKLLTTQDGDEQALDVMTMQTRDAIMNKPVPNSFERPFLPKISPF